MSWVLGIGGYSHDASAALLKDGRLVAAVQEERLNRVKHVGGFPLLSIKYCLEAAGIERSDISAIAFYARRSNWDGYLVDVLRSSLLNPLYTLRHPSGFVHSVGYRVQKSMNFRADLARFFYESGFSKRIFHDYDHHACHAASAYYSSPFDQAVVLCVDGGGDGRTTTGWVGQGHRLKEMDLGIRHPHSLGLLYHRITRYLGFPTAGDEYKVMGLAAYGKPVYLDRMRRMIHLDNGGYRLNMAYFNYQYEHSLSQRFYDEYGPARSKGEPINDHFANVAASVQKLYEEVLLHLAQGLKKRTGIRNLAISGGSALNCKGNGRLLLTGDFDHVYVPSAASDLGTSLGAAQYHDHHVMGRPKAFHMTTDAWGPEYTDDEIQEVLDRASLRYERITDPAATAGRLIAEGHVVGWFQGRMEFGPRALGQRSILADPRHASIKDRINRTIKFREEFRPFAPAILREHVAEYFNAEVDCPFMTFTLDVLPERRHEVEGIVHVDGTGRLQTVARDDQPLYYGVIEAFYKQTGVPVVLNTSFNLAGEPIVCSPNDALRTFYTCGLDVLVIGNHLLRK